MDLPSLTLLVEIIDAGNLSQAARKLKMTRANVSYHLTKLEKAVGVQLVQRTTRRVEPTEIGLRLYEHGLAMRHDVMAADEVVNDLGKGLHGTVRLGVPIGYGQLRMSAWLTEFMRRHPDIALHAIFNNDLEELVTGSIDFAVRVMAEPPPHLVARRLGTVRYVACAAPAFLEQHGRPQNLEALKAMPLIASSQTGERLQTTWLQGPSRRVARIRPRLLSANFHFLLDAIAQGLGVGLMPDYMVARAVGRGELEILRLEPEALEFLSPQKFLLHVPDRYQTPAVRALIDFIVAMENGGCER